MGKITEELVALITKQVQDHGLVVWYDPERAYGEVVDQLPETSVLCYQSSFFELRHRLEPFLEFADDAGQFHTNLETPPRVLVYVPHDRAKTQHALVEAEQQFAHIFIWFPRKLMCASRFGLAEAQQRDANRRLDTLWRIDGCCRRLSCLLRCAASSGQDYVWLHSKHLLHLPTYSYCRVVLVDCYIRPAHHLTHANWSREFPPMCQAERQSTRLEGVCGWH